MKKEFSRFDDFVKHCERNYPPSPSLPEAAWANQLAAGWRVQCARTGRDPGDLGHGTPRAYTSPQMEATEAEAARWREEAMRQAQLAQTWAGGVPAHELAAAWLTYRGRRQDGRALT